MRTRGTRPGSLQGPRWGSPRHMGARTRGSNSPEAAGTQKGFPEKLTSTLRLEGGVESDHGSWGEEGSFTEEAPLFAENCQ